MDDPVEFVVTEFHIIIICNNHAYRFNEHCTVKSVVLNRKIVSRVPQIFNFIVIYAYYSIKGCRQILIWLTKGGAREKRLRNTALHNGHRRVIDVVDIGSLVKKLLYAI
jgi:hypothetical protein